MITDNKLTPSIFDSVVQHGHVYTTSEHKRYLLKYHRTAHRMSAAAEPAHILHKQGDPTDGLFSNGWLLLCKNMEALYANTLYR